ncbi:MAG: hypothetical protein IJ356_03265 [Erysipelotrichaceae bacterium]|nr:hypothetical protein [Erysipelotrichaceae bacterium]
MEKYRMATILEESKTLTEKDTQKIIHAILFDEELNRIEYDAQLTKRSTQLGVLIYETMSKSIGKDQAMDLLEQYDEVNNAIHDAENEHWFKAGVRMGFAFHQILSQKN